MPHASYKTTIEAPYEKVSALLVDKMEWPKKYVGVILFSRILERGEDYLVREMYQPPPVDLMIKEKIYLREIDGGQEFVYEHIDNATYTGTMTNVLTRGPGDNARVELEYIQDWTPHAGLTDKISDEDASRNMKNSVDHMKHLAEQPVEVPDFVREFYEVVDSMGSDAMTPLLSENVKFRMGNGPEVLGRDAVVAGSRQVTKMFAGLSHDYVSVNEAQGRTFVDCWVTYTMFDDKTYVLPFLTIFERDGDLISSVKVYGDMSPLQHGWPV
jgi:hypothetical protein